jgi:hypothetical protein
MCSQSQCTSQDSSQPEVDVGVIIGSGKQGINIGGFTRHEEWEQLFDELEHSRQCQVLGTRTDLGHVRGEAVFSYFDYFHHRVSPLFPMCKRMGTKLSSI